MGSFSAPREGIHSIRIFDIAIIDVIFTILGALIISRKHFIIVFIMLIVLSIIIHTIMGIKTKTNSWAFS